MFTLMIPSHGILSSPMLNFTCMVASAFDLIKFLCLSCDGVIHFNRTGLVRFTKRWKIRNLVEEEIRMQYWPHACI